MHTEFQIQFDPAKARSNFKKHGVRLADGEAVLSDPNALTLEDTDHDEQRWVTLGDDGSGAILVVVYTYRNPNYVRLISARRALAHEAQQYWQVSPPTGGAT
jgi:uncharacterized DUF497 family protein